MSKQTTEVMKAPGHVPRIYIASLSDYNNGILHGEWIDADQDVDQLQAAAAAMLAHSPAARQLGEPAEEWAIHDYEGFGPLLLSEYASLDDVARIGQGIAEHGQAFAHWIAYRGTHDQEDMERFEDVYLGEWHSVEHYAEHILDDLGYIDEIMKAIPARLHAYVTINCDGFGRDLVLGGDIVATETGSGTVYLFDDRA